MGRSEEVDAWLAQYDNPMKQVVEAVRAVILSADPRIEETVKWQAPTFAYKGNLASFFPKSKGHASLMFHTGASIPGDYPSLEGEAKEGRTMRFADLNAVTAKADELSRIVVAWCDLKDQR